MRAVDGKLQMASHMDANFRLTITRRSKSTK